MVRSEFIIIGCILVLVGGVLCYVGYNKMQPTEVDQVISFAEDIMGENAPSDWKSSKREGYIFIASGGVVFLAGLVLILKCRTSSGK